MFDVSAAAAPTDSRSRKGKTISTLGDSGGEGEAGTTKVG